MKKQPKYPLEQIALIKAKRLEESEKILKQKKELLEQEYKKLEETKKKLEKVKKHRDEKMAQFEKELDEGTTSDKVEIHDRYIKNVVNEELKIEKNKVETQKKAVKVAEHAVEEARKDYLKKNMDVEKLKIHKEEWKKEVAVELSREEIADNDELGSNIHTLKNRNKNLGKYNE